MLHFGGIETKFERTTSLGSGTNLMSKCKNQRICLNFLIQICTSFLKNIICLMKHETQLLHVKHKHTHTMLQLRKFVNQTFTLCLGLIVMFNGLLTPYSNKLVELKTIAN